MYKTADVQLLIIPLMILVMAIICIVLKQIVEKIYNASPTSPVNIAEKTKLKTKLKSLAEEFLSWFRHGGWRL